MRLEAVQIQNDITCVAKIKGLYLVLESWYIINMWYEDKCCFGHYT